MLEPLHWTYKTAQLHGQEVRAINILCGEIEGYIYTYMHVVCLKRSVNGTRKQIK
jgi:hypothetical protein